MAYDPQLRLDPALFNELRRVYPELTENKFHVLLANLLDNRPLPSNAPFLKLLKGHHDFNAQWLFYEVGGKDYTIAPERNGKFKTFQSNITAYVEAINCMKDYLKNNPRLLKRPQVKELYKFLNCLKPERSTLKKCKRLARFTRR
jgi:hypothetical protein